MKAHVANVSTIAGTPISMGLGAVSFAAKKTGLNALKAAFKTASANAFEFVVNRWDAANQGPMGRAFDWQVNTAVGAWKWFGDNNQQFLDNWLIGNHPVAKIKYAPDSIQSREMQNSPGAKALRNEFYARNAVDIPDF